MYQHVLLNGIVCTSSKYSGLYASSAVQRVYSLRIDSELHCKKTFILSNRHFAKFVRTVLTVVIVIVEFDTKAVMMEPLLLSQCDCISRGKIVGS